MKHLLSLPLLLLAGCATIVHGTNESVAISSTPTHAQLFVDNAYIGSTPMIVKMARREKHTVRIELKGYQPYEMTLEPHFSGWAFGNIIFGGGLFIGLAVDAISGGLYQLTPDQINAEMRKKGIALSKTGDETFVAVVMHPDPSWTKIGSLAAFN